MSSTRTSASGTATRLRTRRAATPASTPSSAAGVHMVEKMASFPSCRCRSPHRSARICATTSGVDLICISRNKLQLLGVASLLADAKYEENLPKVNEFSDITDSTYTKQ